MDLCVYDDQSYKVPLSIPDNLPGIHPVKRDPRKAKKSFINPIQPGKMNTIRNCTAFTTPMLTISICTIRKIHFFIVWHNYLSNNREDRSPRTILIITLQRREFLPLSPVNQRSGLARLTGNHNNQGLSTLPSRPLSPWHINRTTPGNFQPGTPKGTRSFLLEVMS